MLRYRSQRFLHLLYLCLVGFSSLSEVVDHLQVVVVRENSVIVGVDATEVRLHLANPEIRHDRWSLGCFRDSDEIRNDQACFCDFRSEQRTMHTVDRWADHAALRCTDAGANAAEAAHIILSRRCRNFTLSYLYCWPLIKICSVSATVWQMTIVQNWACRLWEICQLYGTLRRVRRSVWLAQLVKALAAPTHVRSCVQEVDVRSRKPTNLTLPSIPPG